MGLNWLRVRYCSGAAQLVSYPWPEAPLHSHLWPYSTHPSQWWACKPPGTFTMKWRVVIETKCLCCCFLFLCVLFSVGFGWLGGFAH